MIDLKLTQVNDIYVRTALVTLKDAINLTGLAGSNLRLIEIETRGAVTNASIPHRLGFTPTDVILTRITGGTVTWNYDKFTKDDLNLTTSGAVKLRCLIGRIG